MFNQLKSLRFIDSTFRPPVYFQNRDWINNRENWVALPQHLVIKEPCFNLYQVSKILILFSN